MRPRRSRPNANSSSATGAKRSTKQRDTTVSRSADVEEVTKKRIERGGGSSRVFNSAFCAPGSIRSASFTTTTRIGVLVGTQPKRLQDSLAHDLDREAALPFRHGVDRRDVGMGARLDAAARTAGAARIAPDGAAQARRFASARAKVHFPTFGGPTNR